MFARSPARSFRHSRISSRCFARSSWSFWFDPRSRSHLQTEQFRNAPDGIGQSCCHCRCALIPEMLAVTQLMMRPTEIVGTADHIHARLKGLKTLGGMPTFARQSSQTFPHGCIEAFEQGRIELFASARHGESVLCFLKGSPSELVCDFHYPLLFRVLDHRRDTALGPDCYPRSSWPCLLLHFFSKDTQNAVGIRVPPVCRAHKRSHASTTATTLA